MGTLKACYADPPYIGQAKRHYKNQPLCAEVDHVELIDSLMMDFDAWALSCSEPSRYQLEKYIRETYREIPRVGIWVKPFASFKPGVNPAYAFEPVIFYGGRKRTREQDTTRDWCSCNITLMRGMPGAKPEAFCMWVFEMLNLQPGDELTDLFPGSGAVSRAWLKFNNQQRLMC